MLKKIFEINEKRVSVVNIVLAVLSLVSIFTSYVIIRVIWDFEVAVKRPIDVAVIVLDIVVTIGSPICIIIRNLKLKSVSKLFWHTLLEYAIAFAVSIVLAVVYVLVG